MLNAVEFVSSVAGVNTLNYYAALLERSLQSQGLSDPKFINQLVAELESNNPGGATNDPAVIFSLSPGLIDILDNPSSIDVLSNPPIVNADDPAVASALQNPFVAGEINTPSPADALTPSDSTTPPSVTDILNPTLEDAQNPSIANVLDATQAIIPVSVVPAPAVEVAPQAAVPQAVPADVTDETTTPPTPVINSPITEADTLLPVDSVVILQQANLPDPFALINQLNVSGNIYTNIINALQGGANLNNPVRRIENRDEAKASSGFSNV